VRSVRRWIPESDADLFVDRIERESDAWPDPENVRPVTGDTKDDYLVALYRVCDADVLVSGDRDLTALDEPDVDGGRIRVVDRTAELAPGLGRSGSATGEEPRGGVDTDADDQADDRGRDRGPGSG
jgi:hypothetical protein